MSFDIHFGKSDYHEWMLDFVSAFSASIEMILWFLPFPLLLWCMTLIDLHMLNHPSKPEMNPYFVVVCDLFYMLLDSVG